MPLSVIIGVEGWASCLASSARMLRLGYASFSSWNKAAGSALAALDNTSLRIWQCSVKGNIKKRDVIHRAGQIQGFTAEIMNASSTGMSMCFRQIGGIAFNI